MDFIFHYAIAFLDCTQYGFAQCNRPWLCGVFLEFAYELHYLCLDAFGFGTCAQRTAFQCIINFLQFGFTSFAFGVINKNFKSWSQAVNEACFFFVTLLLLGGILVDQHIDQQIDPCGGEKNDIHYPCSGGTDRRSKEFQEPYCGETLGIDQAVNQPGSESFAWRKLKLFEKLYEYAVERYKYERRIHYERHHKIGPRAKIQRTAIVCNSPVSLSNQKRGAKQQYIRDMYERIANPN